MRLSTRIAVLCAAAVLPSLVIQGWHEVAQRRARTAEIQLEAQRFALQAAAELDRILDGAEHLLEAVGGNALRRGATPDCDAEVTALLRLERYAAILVADSQGRVLCRPFGWTGPVSLADRPYFRTALASGRFEVGTYQFNPATGQAVLPVALPLLEAGEVRQVAIIAFNLDWLSRNLVGSGAMPPGGSVTVADREGVIVARMPLPERFLGTRIPIEFEHLLHARDVGAIEVRSQDGTRRMLGYVPLGREPVSNLYVSAGFATDPAYAAMNEATQRAMLLILAGLFSALGAAWIFGHLYLSDPIERLLVAMRRWAEGDRTARITVSEGWEVGRLAAGFNAMAEAVAAREQALRDGEARLRDVLEQMPVGVLLAEIPDGRIVFRNARAAALLREGEAALDLLGEAGEMPPDEDPLHRAIREGTVTEGLELPLRRADGSETVISLSAAPVRAAGGPPLVVVAFLDIGARRHAERQQELLTAELRHRVKNALAVVQAVAAQTMAASSSLEEFRSAFGGRLRDLARAQDALFAAEDGRVQLGWLIRTALAPFGSAEVATEGPEVLLPARQTLAMALVLHEMATNAAKHGALSPDRGGRLHVSWRLRPAPAGTEVTLIWREDLGGGAVTLPETGRGFGARLIARCVTHDLRGRAEWRAEAGGLVWEIIFPVPADAASSPPRRLSA